MNNRRAINQYLRPCLSNPKCSCRQSKPCFSASVRQSETPTILCCLHNAHCQSSDGTSTRGGSTHSR